ncbi:glycerate kinase [Schumannella sp. 10F1B-5-1]|uniref:glycerate kinase n=1 Tax=Schumannella sp. 10F1B-5-1 TaxID=2590780 RepID=UPI001132463B|nr:glycerate kinase [Schumannella sp. 10F1B-5-1]TPW73008.1 glycerate kinase [Schumannella sp. 10F1B-5-1]
MSRILIAPDGFKGTIDAEHAANAIGAGWASVRPDDEVVLLPIADGGEGTLDAIDAATAGATRMPVTVMGPAGVPVAAAWLRIPGDDDMNDGGTTTALIELASASGIEILLGAGALRPLDADTRGVGELVADALRHGAHEIVITLGSSCSTDGGTGLLRALGARFLDANGLEVEPGARGLPRIHSVDLDALPPLPAGGVVAVVDVDNSLTGPAGSAAVFGPQKGLVGDAIAEADAALGALAAQLGIDPSEPGLGAAGGVPLALAAWGATRRGGAETVADILGLDAAVAGADLVITGEGSFDEQSLRGKAPAFAVAVAARHGVPAALIAGIIAVDPAAAGFSAAEELIEVAGDPESALRDPARVLRLAGARLATRSRFPTS